MEELKQEKCCMGGKCCGGKALKVIALLAIGGLGGFFAGRCHAQKVDAPAIVQPAK
jgi:hypothetical protein